MPMLESNMEKYEHEHTHPANRILHAVGIPVIFAGIVMLFFAWRWGLGLFCGGWAMLFLGHKLEGNHPAFFQGPVYFLVGPLWVAREIKEWLTGNSSKASAKTAAKT
jgi:uncharacterized membrane protein YGL010W